jgi:cupin 2 domain-containing protein
MAERRNLLDRVGDLPEELTEELLSRGNVRIERIVSRGHASPRGFWYDQKEDEWVAVLSGRARLAVEGDGVLEMGPGDWAWLPAHRRHRVDWTDPETETVWLAVFIGGPDDADRGS